MIPIAIYGPNPDAPSHMRYAGAMIADGRPGSHWMATGPTAENVRAKLEKVWERAYPSKPDGRKKADAETVDIVL